MSPRPETPAVATGTKTNFRTLTIVTTLFFMWAFITALNDIMVSHLKSIFDLTYTEVMLFQFSFFSAYFIFSMPAGTLSQQVCYNELGDLYLDKLNKHHLTRNLVHRLERVGYTVTLEQKAA
jgi:MFS transporter, FHS family, L-fucose permease